MIREAISSRMLDKMAPDESAALFIARRAEGLSTSEQTLLDAWLAADDANRAAFEGADRAWRSFDDSDGHEILDAMRAHARERPSRERARWPSFAGLAVVAAAACAGLFFVLPNLTPQPRSDPGVEYASTRGQVREVELPDGSRMTLDADSLAIGRFEGATRSVSLERGRAYFVVEPDRTRPFTVVAGGRQVLVTGTRFDVNTAAGGLTVTLVEGHIDIEPADGATAPVSMRPGHQYVERQGMASIRDLGDASEHAIAWREGIIRFDDQRLDEAAEVMNRYTQDQIVIDDPAIAAMHVSGQFRAGETQRFADTLAEVHGLRSVRRASQITLARR